MKFQPDETLAEGAVLAESFNRMKLWPEVRRRMKLRAAGGASDEVSTG